MYDVKLVDISGTKIRNIGNVILINLTQIVRTRTAETFIGGISAFKKGRYPRTNIAGDEKGDLVVDSHSILNRKRNHFSQLLNLHGVRGVRLIETHRAEPRGPEPSAVELEMDIEKLNKYKSPGIDQIPAEMIKVGSRTIRSRSINFLILFAIRKNCLSRGRNQSLCIFKRMVIKETVAILEAYHCYQLHTKFYQASFCQR
jgi:hypothetical protein